VSINFVERLLVTTLYIVPAVNRRLAERGIVLKWFDSAGVLRCNVYNHELYNY
jgi:hypothetical protein